MIDTDKQKGPAPYVKKAIEMVQSLLNFRLIDVEGHYWAFMLDSSSIQMYWFTPERIISPHIVYSKFEIFNLKGDSAAFSV